MSRMMAQPVPQLQSKLSASKLRIVADNQYPSKHQLLRLRFLHRGGSYILHRYRHLFGPIAPLYVSRINIEPAYALRMALL